MLIYKLVTYAILLVLFVVHQKRKREWEQQIASELAFSKYLSTVTSAYGKNQNISDALWEAEEQMRRPLPEENVYVQIFLAVCKIVQKNGDIKWNGVSVFVQNIQCLNEILHERQILNKNRQYLFLGLDYLAVIPVFFLPLMEWWAGQITEELAAFYVGSYAILMYAVLGMTTAIIYVLLMWLMLPYMGNHAQYRIERQLLKNPYCTKLVDWYVNKNYGSCRKKNELLKELQGYGNIREFLVRKLLWGPFGWMPELFLAISKWKSRDKRMEEALRMQTVVLILSHYEEVTVEELLEKMEQFSEIFGQALAEAVDSYSYHRNAAILRLGEEITDEPMQRIFDGLLFCDELPVSEAMQHLEGERSYFMKSSIEEQKKNQQEYAALAKLLAYIPLFLVLLMGLVLPFLAVGLQELSNYQKSLTGFF